jgi:hypothetical protein
MVWGHRYEDVYINKTNILKSIACQRTIRKCLNIEAAHSEGLGLPLICSFVALLSWQCPFNREIKGMESIMIKM